MKFSSFWKQTIRTVKLSLVALVCSVALNFVAAPTLAAQIQTSTSNLALFGWGEKAMAGSSDLKKGTEQLPKIDAAAAQVAERSSPMGLDEIAARSKGGLNEIQGSLDANKMHKADTSKPGSAMAEKIEKVMDKATK